MSPYFLLAILLFTSVVLAGAMGLAWTQFSREKHILFWAGAFTCSAVQWIANAAGLYWHSRVALFLSGIALIASIALAYAGIARRRSRDASLRPITIAAAMTAIITLIVAILSGTDLVLAFIVPAFAAGVMAVSAVKVLPRSRAPRSAELAYSALLGVFALFEVVVMILGFQAATESGQEWRMLYRAVLGLGLPALFFSTGIAAILVVAGDLSQKLLQQSLLDPLTSVLNRRGLDDYGGRAIASAQRRGAALSLLACDLDGFKQLNDRFGHSAGDAALQFFAETLQVSRRTDDVVGRLGGDEFVIILPNANLDQAGSVADAIGAMLDYVAFTQAPGGRLSCSFGIATLEPEDTLHKLIRRADAALYAAKARTHGTLTTGRG